MPRLFPSAPRFHSITQDLNKDPGAQLAPGDPLILTRGNDSYEGDGAQIFLLSLGGDDDLDIGRNEEEVIVFAGAGDDMISAAGVNAATMLLVGGLGDDTVQSSNAYVLLGDGADSIEVVGGADNIVLAGDGNDIIKVREANGAQVYGGAGADDFQITTDTVAYGGAGNDSFQFYAADSGAAAIAFGEGGDDTFYFDPDGGAAIVYGGAGRDVYDIEAMRPIQAYASGSTAVSVQAPTIMDFEGGDRFVFTMVYPPAGYYGGPDFTFDGAPDDFNAQVAVEYDAQTDITMVFFDTDDLSLVPAAYLAGEFTLGDIDATVLVQDTFVF